MTPTQPTRATQRCRRHRSRLRHQYAFHSRRTVTQQQTHELLVSVLSGVRKRLNVVGARGIGVDQSRRGSEIVVVCKNSHRSHDISRQPRKSSWPTSGSRQTRTFLWKRNWWPARGDSLDDIVIVHRGDTDPGRNISGRDACRIVELVLEGPHLASAVWPGGAESRCRRSRSAVNFPQWSLRRISRSIRLSSPGSGRYEIAPNVMLRAFQYNGHLFGNFPGQGEAELFRLSRSEFTIRVIPGVRFVFERDANGKVTGLSGAIGSQWFRGVKRE